MIGHLPDAESWHQRIQIFRDGSLELVDKYAIQRVHQDKKVFCALPFEADLAALVDYWFQSILTPLEHPGPFALFVTLDQVGEFELLVPRRRHHEQKATFDRDTLTFAPTVVDGIADPRIQLRPLFDAIWQAAGIDRSPGYSPTGEWLEYPHSAG